jgi:hypothetical protein
MDNCAIDLKNQPLYNNQFRAGKAEREKYLQAPAWVQKWMDELDKIYTQSVGKAA